MSVDREGVAPHPGAGRGNPGCGGVAMAQDKMEGKQWLPYSLFLGVIDDPGEADKAKEELVQAGIPAGNVEVLDKEGAHERLNVDAEGSNFLEKIVRVVWNAPTLSGLHFREVQDAADEGSRVVLAHIEDEEAKTVFEVLSRHGGRHLEHIDSKGTFTEMAA